MTRGHAFRYNPAQYLLGVFNAEGRRGYALLGTLVLMAALEWGGDPMRLALRYQRGAVADGEWWRLLTAHLVHLDLAHAVVNAAGLVLVWALVVDEFPMRRWALVVLLSMFAISGGLWMLYPSVDWYVGASGVLHGLLAAGILGGVRRGDRVAWIALVLLVLKLGFESWAGPLAFTEGKPVVTAAHWLGALGGAAGGLLAVLSTGAKDPA